jgi:hypothetical protein
MLTDTITMVQGDSEVQLVTLTDQLGNLINDATADYVLCVKRSYADLDAAAILTETVQQTTAGTAYITVQPADTASLTPPAVLIYDIRAEETSGRITTIANGKFIVLPPVHDTP